jgi:murein L,D-transpeptidase YafK
MQAAWMLKSLKWVIVAEVVVAVGVAGFVVARRLWSGPPLPFAVRWTNDPLPARSQPSVKVCKSKFVMTVFDGDRAVKSYRVAVGGGAGDKVKEGDRCTPEGEFYVCVKNPKSDYVLSLGLSYPNEEGAARGLRAGLIDQATHDEIVAAIRSHACPPWKTALGGEIMIHGCRNGREHTLGCVAADDDHIRELYPLIPLGTAVTVVR